MYINLAEKVMGEWVTYHLPIQPSGNHVDYGINEWWTYHMSHQEYFELVDKIASQMSTQQLDQTIYDLEIYHWWYNHELNCYSNSVDEAEAGYQYLGKKYNFQIDQEAKKRNSEIRDYSLPLKKWINYAA